MPHPREHIEHLFITRVRDVHNSTTLANTLNKDIETVFNSHEKFVFELLQNADDSSLVERPLEVNFILRGNTLVFVHNGKHFDSYDVEAICDNAQQRAMVKKLDLDKIGYKGIGFKSVFVISERVHILSGEYSFRFDQNYHAWQQHDPANQAVFYPWQIIPIWTPPEDLNPSFLTVIDPRKVNFIFSIKEGVDLRSILNCILNSPQVILFLRWTEIITIDLNGAIQEIRLGKMTATERILELNGRLHSRWKIFTGTLDIPELIKTKIQLLSPHECPQKLKLATRTSITFVALLTDNKLTAVKENVLHCYLPTKVNAGLPFLVNADFLLSADRTQLLENIWNIFLIANIARLHLEWLKTLTEDLELRDQMLILFVSQLTGNIQRVFCSQYTYSITKAYLDVAFIPAYLKPSSLLLLADATVDQTEFYQVFPELALDTGQSLVRYELNLLSKLPCKQFGLAELCEKLPFYIQANKDLAFLTKIYKFLMNRYDRRLIEKTYSVKHTLSTTMFVLASDDTVVAPKDIYLPEKNIIEYPACVNLKKIKQDLFKIPGINSWLLTLGAKFIKAEW